MIEEISAVELKKKLDDGDDFQLIDVRQPDEYAFAKIEGAKLIPLGEIPSRVGELEEVQHQVAELEERVDFSERLLTQGREQPMIRGEK